MTSPLKAELTIHNRLREKLAEQFPEETEESLADTLEGLTDLNEMLARVMRSAQWDLAHAQAARLLYEGVLKRIERYETRATKKRALVQETMEQAGLRKIEAPDMTISIRKCPPRLVITDESQIPEKFWKTVRQLCKGDLKAVLVARKSVPGAELSNQPDTLSVRTK